MEWTICLLAKNDTNGKTNCKLYNQVRLDWLLVIAVDESRFGKFKGKFIEFKGRFVKFAKNIVETLF